MIKKLNINLYDMIMCLSNAIELVNNKIQDHHKRVAYISSIIAEEAGLSKQDQNELIMASALHDVGAIFLKEKTGSFEIYFDGDDLQEHAEMGYFFLNQFSPFKSFSPIIRYHHVQYDEFCTCSCENPSTLLKSNILFLSDQIELLINDNVEILSQVDNICSIVKTQSGQMFDPHLVDVFINLAKKEYFWLNTISPSINTILDNRSRIGNIRLSLDDLLNLAKLFSKIIDFRSHFTALHSCGVAATAEALAKLMGWPEQEQLMIKIAGYLHDLGKLAVPIEILEKPGKLTDEEFNFIRSHTFYTYRILDNIKDLSVINNWASLHHERLSGNGYPFHYDSSRLCVGSKIMSVADVFTAITEDRPYRSGMSPQNCLTTLRQMEESNALDSEIVSLAIEHFNDLNLLRIESQVQAAKEYEEFAWQLNSVHSN